MIGQGFEDRYLTDDETRAIVRDGLASLALDGRRVLFIIPDGTRTMPMPRMFALFRELLAGRARAVDFLIADLLEWEWTPDAYDVVVAVFIQFLDPRQRAEISKARAELEPAAIVEFAE